MTTYVLPANAVHESAALCDYLVDRLDGGDTVHAVSTDSAESTPEARRDGQDAQNAVYARLGAIATVEQHTESVDTETDPLQRVAERAGADEIIVGYASEKASETEQLLAQLARPVVVVPVSE